MNALHIFAAFAVAPYGAAALYAAALKKHGPHALGSGGLPTSDLVSLFQRNLYLHKVANSGWAVNVLLLVVLPLALIVGLYFIVNALSSDGKDESKKTGTLYSPPAGNIPKPQFQRTIPVPVHRDAPPGSVAATKQPAASALIVQSPSGVVLVFDGALAPCYEHCTVRLRSMRGANDVIRARADELSGDPRVFVESASGVPLALLDTRAAVDKPQCDREVLIHRMVNATWTIGSPCALVKPIGPRHFRVHNMDDQNSIILEVQTLAESGYIDQIVDAQGATVVGNPSEGKTENMIWVTQGADMALIASVVLAVQKLA